MTLELGGKTIIERCMAAFYDSCSRIIVVTGKYHEDVKHCLTPYAKVHIVNNKDYRHGMLCSAKEGVRHVTTDRFFITPGDYPFINADTVLRLINTPEPFTVPVYGERKGHPVILDKLFIPAILCSTAPSLRDCLQSIAVKRLEIPVEDMGVVMDIDTMEDYLAAVKRGANASFAKGFAE